MRWPRGKRRLIFAATAVGAALPRVLSLPSFFVPAALGRVVYQDEVEWGARHVHVLAFPTTLERFEAALRAQPQQFLSTPAVYVWPTASLLVCGSTLTLVYLRMRQAHAASFRGHWRLAVATPLRRGQSWASSSLDWTG